MRQKLDGYGKLLREYDKTIMKYFSDFKCYSEEGKAHTVPIVYGSEDRFQLQADQSMKISLPQIMLYRTDLLRPAARWYLEYQLTFRSLFQNEMDQMLEQLMMRFTPNAEIETENLGDLEVGLRRYRVEEKDYGQVRVKRSDWTISTEIK